MKTFEALSKAQQELAINKARDEILANAIVGALRPEVFFHESGAEILATARDLAISSSRLAAGMEFIYEHAKFIIDDLARQDARESIYRGDFLSMAV